MNICGYVHLLLGRARRRCRSISAALILLSVCAGTAGTAPLLAETRKEASLAPGVAHQNPTSPVPNQLNHALLVSAARAGGDYLVHLQKPDGSFYYTYDARADRLITGEYNMVRHAGVSFALYSLYESTADTVYLEAARRAVQFMKTSFAGPGVTKTGPKPTTPEHSREPTYMLDTDGKAKLGGAGLAVLALVAQIRLDPKSGDLDSAAGLAETILSLQNKEGAYASYYRVRGDEPQDFVSLYYPGEAMLALLHLYQVNGDRRLLASARRGAEYLIQQQRQMPKLPPDAWFMQALEVLYRLDPQQKYADHLMAVADVMIADQYTSKALPGYRGGYGPGAPDATAAGCRAEGLVAAYRIAHDLKDPRAAKIRKALKRSASFQLSQQFNESNSSALPNPKRAAGGFRQGLDSMRIRIDYVQHNISALLGIAGDLF